MAQIQVMGTLPQTVEADTPTDVWARLARYAGLVADGAAASDPELASLFPIPPVTVTVLDATPEG